MPACHKTVEFYYSIKQGQSVNISTTPFPNGGSVTVQSKYRFLTDASGNQIGYAIFNDTVSNITEGTVPDVYDVQNGTYFFNNVGTISYEYGYSSPDGSFPTGVQKFPVLTTSGTFLRYTGYITVNSDNTTGNRSVVIELTKKA